jgi:hypothetical protein
MWVRRNRFVGIIAALAIITALIGCQQTAISDINKHPAKYEGNEVTIAGEVMQSGGDFAHGSFELSDGTGQLWVLSDSLDLPTKGSRIAVTGLVISAASQGPDSLPAVQQMPALLQEIKRYQKGG